MFTFRKKNELFDRLSNYQLLKEVLRCGNGMDGEEKKCAQNFEFDRLFPFYGRNVTW
jgi:hypothetical protein